MTNPSLNIARDGKVLGLFESGKIKDLLESGNLLPTDYYYDEKTVSWIALAEWEEAQPFIPATAKTDSVEGENPEGKKARKKRSPKSKKGRKPPALGGWIACLFALAIAAGIWVWAQTLIDKLVLLETENVQLKEAVEKLESTNQTLSELTPPDRVRAVIVCNINDTQFSLVSGTTVALYRRDDLEKALLESASSPDSIRTFDTDIENLKSKLPAPLSLTVTNADGRVDLPVPQPGDYVLMATASKNTKEGPVSRYVWLIGFHTEDQPHGTLLLDEKSAITSDAGHLEIRNAAPFTSGAKN